MHIIRFLNEHAKLLASSNKIKLIKAVRSSCTQGEPGDENYRTKVGLKEAKDVIDSLVDGERTYFPWWYEINNPYALTEVGLVVEDDDNELVNMKNRIIEDMKEFAMLAIRRDEFRQAREMLHTIEDMRR